MPGEGFDDEPAWAQPLVNVRYWLADLRLRPQIGARGAVAALFVASLLGGLAAQSLHVGRLTGIGFATGCAVAGLLTRRRDLLVVVTAPPVVFLAAVTCAELLAAHASHVALSPGRIAGGVFLTLAATAPWLFCGFAGAFVIATARGLARCVGELRSELAGARHPAGHLRRDSRR